MSNLQSLNAANRREAARRSALDDYLCLVDLGNNRSAMLLDVSETGIGVQSVEGVGEGVTTDFRFQLPDTAVLVEGEGEIAWFDRAGRMGIRFTKIADELKPELRHWVSSESNPLFARQPDTEEGAELDARDRVAQLEARIIVSGWAQMQALNFLVDQIAAMTQASGVAIAAEDGNGIVCKASAGIAPQTGVRINTRSGLSWECVRTKEVVTCVDTENDPRVDRLVCRELNMRSAMLVPVMKDREVAGLVEVFSSRPHAFSNQTVILLKRVAEAVASLDETAPDVAEDSVPQKPVFQPEQPPIAPSVETKSAPPVIVKPAPPSPPLTASVPKPAASVSTPEPAPPAPIVPAATVPAPTKLGIPFAQEVAAAAKPVQAAPLPKPVDVPAIVTTPGSPAAAAPRLAEVAPLSAQPVVKPAAQPVVAATKPAPVAASAAPVTAPEPPAPAPKAVVSKPVPRERVVKVEKVSPGPAVARSAPALKPVEAPPAPARVPTQTAPLPAVAFSGAAAAATKMFETPAAPLVPVPAAPVFNHDEQRSELAMDNPPDIVLYGPELDEKPDHRKIYIGAAAVVMIGMSAVGGWYWAAHQSTPVTPVAQASNSQPATAQQPPLAQPANVLAASASTTALPATTPAKSPASKPLATTTPAAVKSETANAPAAQPVTTSVPSAPITAGTFVPRADQPAPPPSLPVAPPNTVGMATLLAAPVAAPTLSRVNVSQGVTGGKQIVKVQPLYPSTARALHLSGIVTVTAHVAKNGSVTDVKIIKGHPLLTAAAADAVKRWKYEPFLLNGQPIENDVNVQVRFDIPR